MHVISSITAFLQEAEEGDERQAETTRQNVPENDPPRRCHRADRRHGIIQTQGNQDKRGELNTSV